MSSTRKNKHGEDIAQQVTYLKSDIKEQFKVKCKLQDKTPSSVIREFIIEYISS